MVKNKQKLATKNKPVIYWSIELMSDYYKSNLPARTGQEKTLAPVNKRAMFYLVATVIMLCGALVLTNFNLI